MLGSRTCVTKAHDQLWTRIQPNGLQLSAQRKRPAVRGTVKGRRSTFLTIAAPAKTTAATVTPRMAFCRPPKLRQTQTCQRTGDNPRSRLALAVCFACRLQQRVSPLPRSFWQTVMQAMLSTGAPGNGRSRDAARHDLHRCRGPQAPGVERLAAQRHPLTCSVAQGAMGRQRAHRQPSASR